jgi:trehalose 6-phosphate synthase/phosphatase
MRIIVISNRLPFTVACEKGVPEFRASPGGLTTGLWSFLERASADPARHFEFLWVGWPGAEVPADQQDAVRDYGRQFRASPVFLPEASAHRFYHGFCNQTLWPLFHYFPSITQYEEEDWQNYQSVNAAFAEALLPVLRPDDIVWVHDYQLMLLPRLLRQHFPEMPIGFFLHIPFPSFEVFRLLPRLWRAELLEGVLGANVVGFHTHDYTRDFLTSVMRTLGYEHQLGSLSLRDRVVKVDTFPMGIDFERFSEAARSSATETQVAELRARCGALRVIFSVDRLDYTKGLINRLRGYELFLKRNPQWHGKVVFVLSVAPSRVGVESYRAMKQELEETVGRIAGAYGNVNWNPLIYQYRNVSFDEIVALYRACDVALITPLRDGMNLVAKEFIASRPDQTGVLILSEMAGAAKEMGEALIVNPFHSDDFARVLEQALTMPVEEQIKRNQVLQDRLRRYDVNRWADEFLQSILSSQKTEAARRARTLTGRAQSAMVQQYRGAARRALLLDYDGTLVPFADIPRMARPDSELLELITVLAAESRNEVVIVSGRPRADLEEWFGSFPISLIAEHGMWLRHRGGEWRQLRIISTDCKDRVRPILQLYVDRLPGALLEEKEFSLAWHYRRADPEQASLRAQELVDDLSGYTRNIDVQVLEGNKVIEIRNTGINKGMAALEWLANEMPQFILGVGDDWTDEDLFRALPPFACSIRVGMAKTAAQFHLGNHAAVRRLLKELGDVPRRKDTRALPLQGPLKTVPLEAPLTHDAA